MALITLRDISLAFGGPPLFDGINLQIEPGDRLCLMGRNGTGKSTLMKLISGDIPPEGGEVIRSQGLRVALVSQEIPQEVAGTVFEVVAQHPHAVAGAEQWEHEQQVERVLNRLHLEPEAEFATLSGGTKRRVLLARALVSAPDILLLDEPTNHLDLKTINWLEEFLSRFNNTVIVVSHDRHFLNQVCTHMADIDFGRIQVYVGNYDFWYQASQLTLKQKQDENRKVTDRANELKEFIQRFSSNASKAKQATSRKKLLEKLTVEEMPVSSRKYPHVVFKPERPCGDIILEVTDLSKTVDGVQVFKDLNLNLRKGDKIAFVGGNSLAKTTLFQILAGELEPDSGSFRWGVTITSAYFPKENGAYFDNDLNLIEWLGQYSPPNEGETFARGFLGRMLFSGDEATKKTKVLSGGERVRCMLSRMMLTGANVLILDEPTNHLDLESITALNNGLISFSEVVLFASHDHEFVSTVANRIVEFTPGGIIDRMMTFEEYLENEEVARTRDQLCQGHADLTL